MTADILAVAAKFERERRGESYPRAIHEGRITAEAAAIDYQCWVAIEGWLSTGQFRSFNGGANPEGEDAPVIRWPELEAAAEKALNQLHDLVAKQEREIVVGDGNKLTDLYVRRARLVMIHRKVQLRRQMIDSVNAELRAKPEPVAA